MRHISVFVTHRLVSLHRGPLLRAEMCFISKYCLKILHAQFLFCDGGFLYRKVCICRFIETESTFERWFLITIMVSKQGLGHLNDFWFLFMSLSFVFCQTD